MNVALTNYAYLIQKIDEFIRKYYLSKVVRGCIYLTASLFIAYLLITTLEYYGNFNPIMRTILLYSFLLGNFIIFCIYILLPLLAYVKLGQSISHEKAAEIIGSHFHPVQDKLLNTLQLKKLADENPEQRKLIEASIDQKIGELKPVPFTAAVNLGDNRKYLKYALMPLGVILIIALAAPSIFSESTARLINYDKQFVKKAPFSFLVLNKNLSAMQGEDFTLEVKLVGNEIPSELYLEDGANTFKLEKESIIRFNYTFKNLQQNKNIRILAGAYHSGSYNLQVRLKPTLLNFDVYFKYPLYLGKKNESVNNSGDLIVPEGTQITWNFKSQNATHLDLGINKKIIHIKPSGDNRFNFSYRALSNITYSLSPGNNNVSRIEPVSYQIQVIPDLNPLIEVNERADSVGSKKKYFIGQVRDDYGFTQLKFIYRVLNDGSGLPSKSSFKTLSFNKTAIQSNFFHVWDITQTGAKPGQQIEYYFEIFDNDGVNGAKSSKTALKTLRLPTQNEIEKKLDSNSESIKNKVEQAIKQAGQVEKEAKRLNQDLLNKNNLSFDEKKQVEALLKKQKELENTIKEVQQDNKQNQSDQNENFLQRKDILEKQKQIEDLFNNVLDEKTREILKNIEKLLSENNKDQTQEELSKMQVDNKTLKKELDRILELYKSLEFEQKLTQTIDNLNNLSKDQQALSEKSLQKKNDLDVLKNQQMDIKQEFENIKKDLAQLEKKNEELAQKENFQKPDKEETQISEKIEESSKNLENKKQEKASENQKSAADKMKQLSKNLESMQEDGEMKENEINEQNLREILSNLLQSSFKQEEIMQSLRKTIAADPGYTSFTQQQKNIKDNLKMIEDSLFSLSKKVPQIETSVNKEIQIINLNLNKSLINLAERQTAEANNHQQYAMAAMNNLALMLSEALEKLQQAKKNSQSGKGKKKKSLAQLSKMQEQLNKNMQSAKQKMEQEGKQGQSNGQKQGKGQMSQQLAQMAKEQQLIRQAMQEINRDLNKDGKAGKAGLGNLNKLIEQMEQTESDLVNKKIERETLIRQQEIFSKLLEADKAEREREQDNQRESKQAINQPPNYKIILNEFQRMKNKETELLKTVPPSLNSYFKLKVADYFKNLNTETK